MKNLLKYTIMAAISLLFWHMITPARAADLKKASEHLEIAAAALMANQECGENATLSAVVNDQAARYGKLAGVNADQVSHDIAIYALGIRTGLNEFGTVQAFCAKVNSQ